MNPKLRTQLDKIIEEINKQFQLNTPEIVKEAIAIQLYTAREARERIEKEGSVVRDPRGSVIQHPALKIESDAMKIYTNLISQKQPENFY